MRQAYEGWVKSIRGMIDSKQPMPVPTKLEEYVHGRGYALLTPNKEEAMPLWNNIGASFEKSVTLATDIQKQLTKGNYAECERIYKELDSLSKKTIKEILAVVDILVKTDFSALYNGNATK